MFQVYYVEATGSFWTLVVCREGREYVEAALEDAGIPLSDVDIIREATDEERLASVRGEVTPIYYAKKHVVLATENSH